LTGVLVVCSEDKGIGSKWWMGSKWLPIVVKYSMLERQEEKKWRQAEGFCE
jgi:hypothetical protein